MSDPQDLPARSVPKPGRDAMSFFVGLDWGSTGHAVCVLDEKRPSSRA